MSCRIVLGPSFRALENRLLDELCSPHHDPLSPRWVVTPTRLAAARLRIRLAEGLGPDRAVGGIRILPLSALIHRLIARVFGTCAPRWSPAHELLLLHLLGLLDPRSRLGRLRSTPGGQQLVIPALLDLADAGFTDAETDLLLELAADPELPEPAGETLELYCLWLQLLRETATPWQPLQQQALNSLLAEGGCPDLRSSLAAEPGQEPQIFVYGFYDFTDINLGVLAGIAHHHPVHLYLPVVRGHVTFGFAEELFQECLLRFPRAHVETLPPDDPVDRFFVDSFPEGQSLARPAFLTWSRAGGPHAEALSAAAVVRSWLDSDPSLEPWQVLVIVPDVDAAYLALRTAFAEFHLPLVIPDRPGAPDPGEPFRALLQVLEERAPVDRVLDYLRRFPEVAARFGLDLDTFEAKLRALPLAGGNGWRILLEGADDGLWSASEKEFFARMQATWLSPPTPDDLSELGSLIEAWLPDGTRLPDLTALPPPARAAGVGRPQFGLAEYLTLAVRGAGEPPPGPASVNAVTVLSAMRARGITASRLVFVGLGANGFPFRIEEDPLLPDPIRRRLQTLTSAVGHRLAVRAGVRREMLLLFHLLNTAAERVHWVIPEADEFGKATAPSPWVQRYLQRWTDTGDASILRMPRGPLPQARVLRDLDPERGRLLPVGSGILLGLPLSCEGDRLILREKSDLRERIPGCGWMPEEALSRTPRRISVTQLEVLGRCPFRFWATALARLRALEPPPSAVDGLPLHLGRLVHQALHHLLQPGLGEAVSLRRKVGQLRPMLAEACSAALRSPEYRFLPPAVSGWLLRTARRMVSAYLSALEDGGCRDGIPLQLELKVRGTLNRPLALEVSGRIDRLDACDGQLHIVDYKTGQNPFQSQGAVRQELALGFRLQPLLYPRLLDEPATFSFVFLGADPPQEELFEAPPDSDDLLDQLLELPAQGCFVPWPTVLWARLGFAAVKPCSICSLTSLCRRFDPGAVSAFETALQRYGRSRLAGVLAAREAAG